MGMEARARSLSARLYHGIQDIQEGSGPSYYLHLVSEADEVIDALEELQQADAVYQVLVHTRNQLAAYIPRLGVRQARSTK